MTPAQIVADARRTLAALRALLAQPTHLSLVAPSAAGKDS